MHATAHKGECAPQASQHWKLTLGEKSLAAPGNQTCIGGVKVHCSINWATSPPCHRPACQTLFCTCLKSMKLWNKSRFYCRCFSVMTRLSKICSAVFGLGLKPACSPASSSSALAWSQQRITKSMNWLGWLKGSWYDSSDIAWGCLSLVKVWRDEGQIRAKYKVIRSWISNSLFTLQVAHQDKIITVETHKEYAGTHLRTLPSSAEIPEELLSWLLCTCTLVCPTRCPLLQKMVEGNGDQTSPMETGRKHAYHYSITLVWTSHGLQLVLNALKNAIFCEADTNCNLSVQLTAFTLLHRHLYFSVPDPLSLAARDSGGSGWSNQQHENRQELAALLGKWAWATFNLSKS